MSERRPWGRAIAWTAFLGPFFFASYGFANWLASRRADVGSVVFAWERAIPFVPWTIVPYWSTDLFYVVSLLVCTTRRELDRQAQRLLAVQIVSVIFFIAFPLRFSFDRPEVGGPFGALFALLGSFDKPFNQAPSLHIGLVVLIWTRLAAHLSPRWRWALHAWMTLMAISILTTYQHHFIDLPTGLAAGLAVVWALPEDAKSPLRGMAVARDADRRRLAALYGLGSVVAAAVATRGGAWLWFAWLAAALGLVSLIYLAIGARGFQKSADGRLSVGALGLLAPYIGGAWVSSRVQTRRHSRPAEVVDGVWIGRIPGARELAQSRFDAVVDLTAELPFGDHRGLFYRSVPVLDLTVPTVEVLRAAAESIEEARRRGTVLVCCALGYSRSAAAVIAWLLLTRRAETVEAGKRTVMRARPPIVLRGRHEAALRSFA